MRILALRLLAYGHFTDEELNLSAEGALHLVHGPNEAGKSTALRAITGLLFGIPERTSDAHVHPMNKLRIGGRLAAGGDVFEVVRKKGRKNTLLGPDGEPVDEAQLGRALAGVSEAIFRSMFGLDHVSLREGAKALLAGEGGLGEGLFDAGGARGIGAVLAGLRDEAAAIFKPRGKQALNQAIEAHAEAKKAILLKGTEPRAYDVQEKAFAAAVAERASRARARQELETERIRLDRARRVMPLLSQRRELTARRAALGSLPRLPDDVVERRDQAQQRLRECARDRERLEAEVESLREQRSAIEEPGSLAALEEELLTTLRDQRAVLRKTAVDLPRRRGELTELKQQIQRQVRDLGREPTLDTFASLRVDKPTLKRIEALADQHGRLAAAVEGAERALAARRRRLVEIGGPAAADPSAEARPPNEQELDLGLLEAAITRATRAGDIDRAVARATEERRHAADRVARALARLGLRQGGGSPLREGETATLERALSLSLPPPSQIAAQEELWRDHDEAVAALAARRARLEVEGLRLEQATAELELGGEVPSEEELGRVRLERDQAFAALRAEKTPKRADLDGFEELSRRADDLADRLRREVSRVERHARLALERQGLERERERLDEEEGEEARAFEAARTEFHARLAEVGLGPQSPAELLALLERQGELTARAEALAAAELEERTLHAQRADLREALARALAAVSSPEPRSEPPPAPEALGPLLDRASLRLEALRRRARERDLTLQTIAGAEAALGEAAADHQAASLDLERWRQGWATEMPKLGLGAGASVDEVKAILAGLRELMLDLDKADDLGRRIQAMERDARAFADMLAPLCEAHAPDLSARAADDAAGELLRRADRAREDFGRRARLTHELRAGEASLETVAASQREAEAVLADLFAIAGVQDAAGLVVVERRWAEHVDLERQLAETDARLLGEGATIEELEELTRDLEIDGVRARLSQIEGELEEAAKALTDLDQQIGRHEYTLQSLFAEREGAYVAAGDQQSLLARVRRLADRYATLTLAATVLEREIERYREKNQGPIITRASELFPILSLGEYTQVRVSFDTTDDPELRCVGVDGADVGVEGLSDGARDQLYLALRLASLERFAEQRELLPFVADDILVHFDEERASAALRVLADFASVTQVLMFTHHARHVELARQVVPEGRLVVHQLAGRRRSARAR